MPNMTILHIGNIRDLPQSGVRIVVPKYIEHQSRHANVALLNIGNYVPINSKGRYLVTNYKSIKGLRKLGSLLTIKET